MSFAPSLMAKARSRVPVRAVDYHPLSGVDDVIDYDAHGPAIPHGQ
jgi:hypothetical protein